MLIEKETYHANTEIGIRADLFFNSDTNYYEVHYFDDDDIELDPDMPPVGLFLKLNDALAAVKLWCDDYEH